MPYVASRVVSVGSPGSVSYSSKYSVLDISIKIIMLEKIIETTIVIITIDNVDKKSSTQEVLSL